MKGSKLDGIFMLIRAMGKEPRYKSKVPSGDKSNISFAYVISFDTILPITNIPTAEIHGMTKAFSMEIGHDLEHKFSSVLYSNFKATNCFLF